MASVLFYELFSLGCESVFVFFVFFCWTLVLFCRKYLFSIKTRKGLRIRDDWEDASIVLLWPVSAGCFAAGLVTLTWGLRSPGECGPHRPDPFVAD